MKELNAGYVLRKLNEEDMLEILTEHYMASSFKGEARGLILGTAGIDLRFIGIWAREPAEEIDKSHLDLNRDIALHHALNEIDLEKLDREMNFNGNHSFFDKNPDYSSICRSASVQQLRNALESGVDVNARDSRGKTPLMHVVYNPDFMKVLLEAGADVNARDEDGMTTLMFAVCAYKENLKVIKRLIDAGADVNAEDEDGVTALMLAAQNNKAEVVRMLLRSDTNVDAKDRNGVSALMYAVWRQSTWQDSPDLKIVHTLLSAGANVNARNKDGMTALMFATNDLEIVNTLLQAGADVNARDEEGMTVLMHAVSNGSNPDSIGALLEAGADVNERDGDGMTALMYAVWQSSPSLEAIDVLLKFGTNIA